MTRLSININKVALLRNARGGNIPDVLQFAKDCEQYGAQGITVHPRPDARHITYQDVHDLKKILQTELNVEGYPSKEFISLVNEILPDQVTLVPDSPEQITSNHGWDTIKHKAFLKEVISEMKQNNIRVSLFINPDKKLVEAAFGTGADRIELYTESYAQNFLLGKEKAIAPFIKAAQFADQSGFGVNAGHDLNLDNVRFFQQNIPELLEVSIGHALIRDALYYGIANTIQLYLKELER